MADIEMSRAPTRDEARSKIFANLTQGRKIINFRGVDLEIRQPSVGDMIDMSKRTEQGGDQRAFILDILLKYVYIPGTDTKVFDDADVEGLRALPWNKEFQGVIETFGDLSGVDFRAGKGAAQEE